MSVFDTCGLKQLSTTEADDMIENFKNYNSQLSPANAMKPTEIYLSRQFLCKMADLIEDDPALNCVRLRLGLRNKVNIQNPKFLPWYKRLLRPTYPSGSTPSGEILLSWMMQAVGAEVVIGVNKGFTITAGGAWYAAPSPGGGSVEPPEVGVPPYAEQ